ncbi:hypothetical protein DAI22_11g060001 [Oryza sativa Japonica Group]|nr:hypothetical protein DAI22_11g060001 [Oryza sativa Japonica Group]
MERWRKENDTRQGAKPASRSPLPFFQPPPCLFCPLAAHLVPNAQVPPPLPPQGEGGGSMVALPAPGAGSAVTLSPPPPPQVEEEGGEYRRAPRPPSPVGATTRGGRLRWAHGGAGDGGDALRGGGGGARGKNTDGDSDGRAEAQGDGGGALVEETRRRPGRVWDHRRRLRVRNSIGRLPAAAAPSIGHRPPPPSLRPPPAVAAANPDAAPHARRERGRDREGRRGRRKKG